MNALARRSFPSQAVCGVLLAACAAAFSLLAATPAPAQTMTNTFGGFSKNSNQPIDIESDVLVVHDAQKYATFKGNVKAVQGTTTLRSRELDVHYVGSGSDSLTKGPDTTGSTPAPTPGATPGTGDAKPSGVGLGTNNGTQISKIEARGEVVITSDQDQTTTSDWALYDVPAQLVTVGGNVVLMQGKNVLKGDRLVIDLKTGESRFENRGSTAAGGRIRALFMPKEAKPGDDNSKSDTSSGGKSAEKSADTGAGSEKAAAPAAPAAAAKPAANAPMPLLPGAPQ
ncbi:MAG TPA: LptA/OstA family protein [Methyloceanibacter sp.]|nr:LptA/OstA family protein [Methyloceanibacter sp.]